MPKKMRTTRNLLLMATLLGSALFARAADKEMTIGAIYLDTQVDWPPESPDNQYHLNK